jgi:hypothetical protein
MREIDEQFSPVALSGRGKWTATCPEVKTSGFISSPFQGEIRRLVPLDFSITLSGWKLAAKRQRNKARCFNIWKTTRPHHHHPP